MRHLLACIAAVALVACGSGTPSSTAPAPSKGPAESADRVRLQLNWVPEPEFGGIYAAEREGYFRDEGLEVELLKGGPGVAAPQLAASGQVEFAVVGGDQVLTLRDAKGELVAIFASFQSDPMGIMVHEGSPYRTIEELWRSDATIACETNLPFVAMLNRRFGGENLKFVAHGGSVAQFAANPALAQQCFVFAEPVTLEMQKVPTRVFTSSTSGYDPYNVVVAAGADLVRDRPELVAKMARALSRGWRSYIDNPGPTNERMAALNPSMSKEAMDLAAAKQASLLQSADTERLGLGAMTKERWGAIAGQLRDLGKLKSEFDPATVFRWTPIETPAGGSSPR
jgi:NitT/TauT family transport system substrate-binding protein